jgi:hypothetical protein
MTFWLQLPQQIVIFHNVNLIYPKQQRKQAAVACRL